MEGMLFMDINEMLKKEKSFRYGMLNRMQTDCEYFLGYGYRNEKHLWAGDVATQIDYMKQLYNSFDEKPEWLTWEEILSYEKQMQD